MRLLSPWGCPPGRASRLQPSSVLYLKKSFCSGQIARKLWKRGFSTSATPNTESTEESTPPPPPPPPQGYPQGSPANRRVMASAELYCTCASVPTSELQAGRCGPSSTQSSAMVAQKDTQSRCLAEVRNAPSVAMAMPTRQDLQPPSVLYFKKSFCSGEIARKLWKRGFSTSATPTPPPPPPPQGWKFPFFDQPPLKRSASPGYIDPDFAKCFKSLPGVVPEICLDESAYLINYKPEEYMDSFPLARTKTIHGFKPEKNNVLLPMDHGLFLMRSLPMLARYYHQQGCCLPRLEMDDLVVTGSGKFRLRGCKVAFRERTEANMKDVYQNISYLFKKMLVRYGPLHQLHKAFFLLDNELNKPGFPQEYLILFNTFFLPLGNKSVALLRMIDVILEMPPGSAQLHSILKELPDINWLHSQRMPVWKYLATRSEYLKQWLSHRSYLDGRMEFLRFLRAVLCHKLKYGLPDKLVDFLVHVTYPHVLGVLQRNFLADGKLKQLQFEELFPCDMTTDFEDLKEKIEASEEV